MLKNVAILALAMLPALAVLPHPGQAAPPALFGWSVKVSVTPDPMPYNAQAAVNARTKVEATCTARVVYNNGRTPVSFHGDAEVASSGVDTWSWHEQTRSGGGVATVTCAKGGTTHTGSVRFTVR